MKPLWKQMFDAAEQSTAPWLQETTASQPFAELLRTTAKINRDMTRQYELASRQWLHYWNLPAAGDMSALKKQIGGLERELRSIRRALEEAAIEEPVEALTETTAADASLTVVS